MQRTSEDLEDRRDVGEWVDVSELIARISAERGLPVEDTGRHRLLLDPDARRSRRRRLAPAIAGVATVLVATTVARDPAARRHAPPAPTLDAALVAAASAAPPPSTPRTRPPRPRARQRPGADHAGQSAARPTAARRGGAVERGAEARACPCVERRHAGGHRRRAGSWSTATSSPARARRPSGAPYDGRGQRRRGPPHPGRDHACGTASLTIRGDAEGTTGGMA